MAALGLRCCAWAFFSCGSGGHSSLWCSASLGGGFSCCRPWALGAWASLVVARGLKLLHGMWDLPGAGLEPMSPALAGGFSTTAPPAKPQDGYFETLDCHLLGLRAFRIKSYSLSQHLISDLLACRVASRASLDLVTYIYIYHTESFDP